MRIDRILLLFSLGLLGFVALAQDASALVSPANSTDDAARTTIVQTDLREGPVFNQTSGQYYNNIQAAINDSGPNDFIIVSPGSYEENLSFPHSLSLVGPNERRSPGTGHGRLTEAIINPEAGSDALTALSPHIRVFIKGFTFDMADSQVNDRYLSLGPDLQQTEWVFEKNIFRHAQRVGGVGNGSWFINQANVEIVFDDNLFHHNAPTNGIYIYDSAQGNSTSWVSIVNNTWKNNGAWAMNLNNVDGVIANNVIKNDGYDPAQWEGWERLPNDPEWPGQYGLVIANMNNDLHVTDNEFIGLSGAGLRVWNNFDGTLQVRDNEFYDNEIAAVSVRGADWMGSTSGILIKNNAFEGNEMGVDNPSDDIIDARHNWWGHETGPFQPDENPDGQGDEISLNVLFLPFYTDPGDLDLSVDPEANHLSGLTLYPNPVSQGYVNLEFTGLQAQEVEVALFNTSGMMLKRASFSPGSGPYRLDLQGLSPGLYHLRVQSGGQFTTGQFIVAR